MNDNESYDYIHGTDIYVLQRKDMFRINTDTSLLAEFMKVKAGECVLDIGTNNGALLKVAAQYQPSYLYGIEIQQEACALAQRNLETEHIPYTITCGDVLALPMPGVDVVVCNPPYFKLGNERLLNPSKALRIARHECYLPFESLCEKVSEALQEKGRFYLVHRCDRLLELIDTLRKHRLQVRTLQFVYDPNKEEAVSVLIEAIKDGGKHLHIARPKWIER